MTILDIQARLGLVDVAAVQAAITIDLQLGVAVSTGTNGDDIVAGSTNNDVIETLLGNDIVIGSDGIDTIDASLGTDILVFDFASARHVNQGVGRDLVINNLLIRTSEGILPTSADVQSTILGVDGLVFRFGQNVGGIIVDDQDDTGDASLFLGSEGVQFISGGGTDTFTGSGADDVFSFLLGAGTATDATANGGAGTDAGIIRIAAGPAQTIAVSEVAGTITVSNGAGEQAVFTGVEELAFSIDGLIPGGAGATTTINASSATMAILADFTDGGDVTTYEANFIVTTGSGDDIIQTNAGNDQLNGGSGANQLSGGNGDDIYYLNSTADQVFEAPNGGNDTVVAAFDIALVNYPEVENALLTGSAPLSATGTGVRNDLIGNSGNNTLQGYGGDDLLVGHGGNDRLNGGTGADEMRGGLGDDVFVVDNALDVIVENPGEGRDRVIAVVDHTLAANVEDLTLTGAATTGFGNALDNHINSYVGPVTIYGMAGNDTLFGSTAGDTMHGGTDDDTYHVNNAGDVIVENPDEGYDRVSSVVNHTLAANVEELRLRGGAATIGTGNALDNVIHGGVGPATLSGLDGNDLLYGTSAGDFLYGGNDDDTLYGRAGADTIEGGEGNDRLYGQEQGDILRGQGGNDFLSGGSGNDTLEGGEGNDRLEGGDNIDTLDGGDGVDALFGGAGSDTLDGGADADIIVGGAGRDFATGGTGADRFRFADGDFAGTTSVDADRIYDFDASEGDMVDLSLVDAIAGGSDDAFTFLGNAAFSGTTAGELRYEAFADHILLLGDTNGDGAADLAIRLDGLTSIVASNIVL